MTEWQDCYNDGWSDLIVPEAFAHPAKMARGLLDRIITHLFALGVQEGETVLDPFGGIGTTAVLGTGRGLRVICVELEPKFVALARQNVELHRRAWEAMGFALPTIVEGDSRALRLILNAALHGVIVTSPPYTGVTHGTDGSLKDLRQSWMANPANAGHPAYRPTQASDYDCPSMGDTYGDTPGNLAGLSTGSVEAVVSSPPYENAGVHGPSPEVDEQERPPTPGPHWRTNKAGGRLGVSQVTGYGETEGQLGAMKGEGVDAVIGSPPYEDSINAGQSGIDWAKANRLDRVQPSDAVHSQGVTPFTYGATAGQLGHLPSSTGVDAVLSSPPYWQDRTHSENQPDIDPDVRAKLSKADLADRRYGDTEGQLGEMSPGEVDAVVASPPFLETRASSHGSIEDAANRRLTGGGMAFIGKDYGDTEGQLGEMRSGELDAVVGSPPFLGARAGTTASTETAGGGPCADRLHTIADGDRLGDTEGQLVTFPIGTVDAVMSSPPYMGGTDTDGRGEKLLVDASARTRHRTRVEHGSAKEYGDTEGQIGAMVGGTGVDAVVTSPPYESQDVGATRRELDKYDAGEERDQRQYGNLGAGETFWSAAQQVVRECYALLKPGGYAVWVVKAFVRNKQLVDFPGDWRRLCEHAGFITIEEVHASLVEETMVPGLFADRTVRRERKSFFRRLAEKKGSPKIDYEVVWIMRKP